MGSKSCIGAEEQAIVCLQEFQDVPIDVYCIICFTPYSTEETYNNIDFEALLSQNNSKQIKKDDIENEFFPRTKYISPNCGVHHGPVVKSETLFVYCPETTDIEMTDYESVVKEKIKIIDDYVSNDIVNKYAAYTFVSLHLAVYSFTQTDDIANCFLCSILAPLKEFYPEDDNLFSLYVLNNPYPFLADKYQRSINIFIDYVLVYDTYPYMLLEEFPSDNTLIFFELASACSAVDIQELQLLEQYGEYTWKLSDDHDFWNTISNYSSAISLGCLTVSLVSAAAGVALIALSGGTAALVGCYLIKTSIVSLKVARIATDVNIAANIINGTEYIIEGFVYDDRDARIYGLTMVVKEVVFVGISLYLDSITHQIWCDTDKKLEAALEKLVKNKKWLDNIPDITKMTKSRRAKVVIRSRQIKPLCELIIQEAYPIVKPLRDLILSELSSGYSAEIKNTSTVGKDYQDNETAKADVATENTSAVRTPNNKLVNQER